MFHAYYVEAQDLTVPANVAAIGADLGISAVDLETGITSTPIKTRLKDAGDEAIAKGIFGSPFFIADGEPFWGVDRLPMLDSWLETGGW